MILNGTYITVFGVFGVFGVIGVFGVRGIRCARAAICFEAVLGVDGGLIENKQQIYVEPKLQN